MTNLKNLEENLGGATPIGRPRILKINLSEIGINYRDISSYIHGFSLNDKPKMDIAFLSQITTKAPDGANAFSCSEIRSFCNPDNVGMAVQYYRI